MLQMCFFFTRSNFSIQMTIYYRVVCALSVSVWYRVWQANFKITPLYTNDAAKTLTASVLRRQLNETGSVRQSIRHVKPLQQTPTLCCCSCSLQMLVRSLHFSPSFVAIVVVLCCVVKRSTTRLNVAFSFKRKQFSMLLCRF